MIVSIVGLGLIGGSLALDLKQTGFASKVIGVENNAEHSMTAKEKMLVDEIVPLEEGIARAQIIILAIPMDALRKILPLVLDKIAGTDKIVTDVGSTKYVISSLAERHPSRENYVAAHPMAGTEYSGPSASKVHLFKNKYLIICDAEKSSFKALELVKAMYEKIGMHVICMDAKAHDMSVAYVSHISHIISFALSLTVIDKEKEEANILRLASGGFESTVRLAKSNAATWVPIFEQNDKNVLEVLDTYIEKLQLFKLAIENKNQQELYKLITAANKIQKILN